MPIKLMVDSNGDEFIVQYDEEKHRCHCKSNFAIIQLHKGDIEKLIGKILKYTDEPFNY